MEDLSALATQRPPTRWAGHPVALKHSTHSTNDDARDAALAGAPHGHAIVADTQTAGRGRRGHTWHSPPGANIYLSMVVRPTLPASSAPVITLAAGLAVVDTALAHGVASSRATIKWPNDIRVDTKKLAGILVEGSLRDAALAHAVIGIGLNVHQESFPDPLADTATSLRIATGAGPRRDTVVLTLLAALEHRLDALITDGPAATIAAVATRCDTLGQRVRIDAIVGTATRLSDSGALVVRLDDGRETEVRAGEVIAT